ncbi:MAG: serine hydrolase domain-containing protein [Chloroflexota bacterium]
MVTSTAAMLAGLWGCEQPLGPAIRGQLRLVRIGDGLSATIAGYDEPVQIRSGAPTEVRFALPDGLGEFRGHLRGDADAVSGHWIQPPRVIAGDRTATPVALSASGPGVWTGDVVPLDELLSLYASIAQERDGGLTAYVRNPEYNFGRGMLYRVVAEGCRVRLVSSGDSEDDPHGTYDAAADRLMLTFPGLGLDLLFTRRKRTEAAGFYPRPVPGEVYSYRQPEAAADGWQTASLEQEGIAEQPICELVQSLIDREPAQLATPCLQGLLIARHGRLVLEEYFHGFDRERPHDMRSASKTFASLLVGIASEAGAPLDENTPVYSLFPEYGDLVALDRRRAAMTVAHLMTMTSGLACDDYDDASPGNEDRLQSQTEEPDWFRYTLGLPLANMPGTKYAYCSAAVNLLGGVIRNAVGTWLPEYFRQRVAEPLQMGRYHINLMPTGDAYMGGGMHLRPRDMLKLGQLHLDQGCWNGRRIVSADWVRRATTPRVALPDGSHDGYNWHCHQYTVGGRALREYDASGNGGQLVMVFPDLDLVVAITAGNYGQYGIWRRFRDELVPERIVAAVRR